MAQIHNSIKHATGILNAYRISAGLSGEAGGVERLGETLSPTIDQWSRDEWAILRGELLWGAFAFVANVAAEFGFIGVGNNSTNQLLTVDGVTARGGTVVQLFHVPRATVAATGAATSTAVARDQRATGSGVQVLQRVAPIEVWTGTDLAALAGFLLEETNPITQDYRKFESGSWIVRPGGVLIAQAGTVNISIGVNFWGRLRPTLPGELPA